MDKKVIPFSKGIHRSPTLGEDGELYECVNLIPKNGELVNIPNPVYSSLYVGEDSTVIAIHKVNGIDHYITKTKLGTHYSIRAEKLGLPAARYAIISKEIEPSRVECIGNVVVLVYEDGLQYARWDNKNSKYITTGDIPEIDIQFGLRGKFTSIGVDGKLEIEETASSNSSAGGSYTQMVASVITNNDYDGASHYTSLGTTLTAGKTYKISRSVNESHDHALILIWKSDNGSLQTEPVGVFAPNEFKIYTTKHQIIGCVDTLSGRYDKYTYKLVHDGYNSANSWALDDLPLYCDGYSFYEDITSSDSSYSPIMIKHDSANFDLVVGNANEFQTYYARNENKFIYPFFVRYAIRLYDGTHVNHSVPCLMQPNDGNVPVSVIPVNISSGGKYPMFTCGFACDLVFQILNFDSDIIDEWKDIIKGITIAVSSPIYRYKQGEVFDERKKQLSLKGMSEPNIHSFGTLALEDSNLFSKHNIYDSLVSKYGKNTIDNWSVIELPQYSDEEVEKDLKSKGLFYQVAEIDFDDLPSYSEESNNTGQCFDVKLESGALSTLETRPLLKDDYNSHNKLNAKSTFVYNGRLLLANISETLYKGFKVPLMQGKYNNSSDFCETESMAVVSMNIEGTSYTVCSHAQITNSINNQWFYYPNANALTATIYQKRWQNKGGVLSPTYYYKAVLSLKQHETLNGSYYYNKNGFDWKPLLTTPEFDEYTAVVEFSNRLYQSNVNNPFAFDLMNISNIGSGEITAISSSAKALSSGTAFGTAPLIAFCTDGIFPMSVASDGTFSSTKPLSRSVCINPDAVLQTDNAVVFVTERGLMVTDGTESGTKYISSLMEGPNLDENMITGLYSSHDSIIKRDTNSFVDMLRSCKMLYDEANSLIHIYPSANIGKHFVYSIDNDEFSTFVGWQSNIKNVIPGYPLSTVQLSDGRMLQYKNTNDASTIRKGLVVTRPIAFGNPLAMKMLSDLRLSYSKNSKDTKCVVACFVSNDRNSWMQLKSLHSHSYKWYMFVVYTSMTDYDGLEAAVCMTEERRTNKIR